MNIIIKKNTLVKTFEKKLGLGKGAIRNPDGSKPRSDKQLKSLIEEHIGMNKIRRNIK